MDRTAKLEEKRDVMLRFERELYLKGITLIAGVDEVGRGPLAGPVVAAAVILPTECAILGIDDSKKLSERKREELFDRILEEAVAVGIGQIDHAVIDEINILQATKRAMREALRSLSVSPEHILIDALTLEDVAIPQTGIIKGDSLSLSIAAASIVAKVTRDRLMQRHDEEFPGYGFAHNKGYGTKAHYEGIKANGVCPIHRRTFLD